MAVISRSNCISCYFDQKSGLVYKDYSGKVDVFYAETKNLGVFYSSLKKYIADDEKVRADKFHFDNDRETYVTCHAVLRLVLSKYLNLNPLEISYKTGINNKPGLSGDPVHFNLAHTRESFAFVVSSNFYVGIDLEVINEDLDIHSLVKSYFSKKERDYIYRSEKGTKQRFFLLWTRKEALLKALGTGIINNLQKVEVSAKENFMKKDSFDNMVSDSSFSKLYIYSRKIGNHYLSVAIPRKTFIELNHLNSENIASYLY